MSPGPTNRLNRALETDRLRLRALAITDHDELFRLQREPAMMRYFGDGHPYGRDESRFWLQWHVDMWDLEGYGFWAVELKPDVVFLG